jgi:hypothetical protein
MINETEVVVRNLETNNQTKNPGWNEFTAEISQIFKKNNMNTPQTI